LLLSLGDKLRIIRRAKGLSLENIAYETGRSVATLSRIERGETDIDTETTYAIKKAMGIEHAPLLEHELMLYKNRMWVWNDIINAQRFSEAKTMIPEMSSIIHLPFESELALLYTLIEMRIDIYEPENKLKAKHKLDALAASYDDMSINARHFFHRNTGMVYSHWNNTKALQHCLLALETLSDETKTSTPILLLNIGAKYYALGRIFHAMTYLERAKYEHQEDRTNIIGAYIDSMLIACYISIGEYDKAKSLAELVLSRAKAINDRQGVALALNHMGHVYKGMKDFETALPFFEESQILYGGKQDVFIVELLNSIEGKAYCLLGLKRFTELKDVIKKGQSLAKNIPSAQHTFESLQHLLTLNNAESTNHIENITIPFLLGNSNYQAALRFCDRLEAYYIKKGAVKKANAIAIKSREIYKMLLAPVVLENDNKN